jgi:hypothetical protein
MKRLEDIPKQNIFEVPDGYFEMLPQEIQARVSRPESGFKFTPMWRLSLPVAAMLVIGFFWWNRQGEPSIEEQLNLIETEQLIAYLDYSDIPSELLTEEVTWSENDLNELEVSVLSSIEFSESELQEIADELIIESENK